MENDNLREETKEEETSSQEETKEEESSSQEETEEETSSQEETEEEETSSQEETVEEETSIEQNSYDPEQSSYETVLLTTPDSIDSYDYTSYFENLQSLGIIITAFILGLGLSLAFALGFKRD